MLEDKFETINTGRGSKTHKRYLKEKIKKELRKLAILNNLKTMSLKELNDRAEILLKEAEEKESIDSVRFELDAINKILQRILLKTESDK